MRKIQPESASVSQRAIDADRSIHRLDETLAEGEAESAETISRAVSRFGDGLIQIRRIEASREIAQTLA